MKRVCKNCQEEKHLELFPLHSTCIGGRAPVCRDCKTSQSRVRRYGVDKEMYNSMLKEQGYVCKICGTDNPHTHGSTSFCVDHCHNTGKIRGLLCGYCNTGLGKFKDSVDLLESAIQYILDSRNKSTK